MGAAEPKPELVAIDEVFRALKPRGLKPVAAFALAKDMHVDHLAAFRAVRVVFGLDIAAAKEAMLKADGIANSLEEYQAKLYEGLVLAERELAAELRR